MNACFGCKRRTVGCHSSCEEYLEFKAKNDAERDKRLAEKNRDADRAAYIKSRKAKNKR